MQKNEGQNNSECGQFLRRLYCPLKKQTALFFRFQNRSNTIREKLSSVLECPYRSSSQLLFKTIIEFLYESAADNSHTQGLLFFICKERATGIVKAKPPLLKYFYLCYFFTVFFQLMRCEHVLLFEGTLMQI